MANVVVARLIAEATHRHVLDHAGAQRADGSVDGLGGHRGLLSRAEGCWTFDARERTPRQSRLTAYSAENSRTSCAPFPRERVRSMPPKPTLRDCPHEQRGSVVY